MVIRDKKCFSLSVIICSYSKERFISEYETVFVILCATFLWVFGLFSTSSHCICISLVCLWPLDLFASLTVIILTEEVINVFIVISLNYIKSTVIGLRLFLIKWVSHWIILSDVSWSVKGVFSWCFWLACLLFLCILSDCLHVWVTINFDTQLYTHK